MSATDGSSSQGPSPWIHGLLSHGDYAIIPAGCWAFQLANACIAISLFQTDILVPRLALAASAIFFIIFGGVCLNISVDTIGWKLFFLLIHVRMIVPLILDRLPTRIETKDREVYNKVFAEFGLPLNAFKILIDGSCRRKSGSGHVLEEGKEPKLILMSEYNGYAMLVKMKDEQGFDQVVTNDPTQHPWIGLVAYINARKHGGKVLDTSVQAHNTFTLLDPATADEVADRADLSDGERLKRAFRREELFKQEAGKEASYYEWSYESLNIVFQHAVHSDAIRNAIDAALFESCMAVIHDLDTLIAQGRQTGGPVAPSSEPVGL